MVNVTLSAPFAAALGLGTGLGLLLLITGLTGRLDTDDADPDAEPGALSRFIRARPAADRRRIALCVAVGFAIALATRWPVAAILAGGATWALPDIIGPDRGHARRAARTEAIATWTEALRDSLSGAAGLEQALTASAIESPEPIRDEVSRLALRLQRGWRLRDALRAFATELADPTADLVVAGLLMAARGSAGQLGDVLGELATSARKKVAGRHRVAAGRQRNRTSARVIVCVTLVMAVGLVVLNRTYLTPFDTAAGQLVLFAAGAMFGFAFWWLARLTRDVDTVRVLGGIAVLDPDVEVVQS